MQFQVPQFIEVEDTIFGPLTFKQFLYIVGGVSLCFIWYVYLPIYISVFFIIPTAILAFSLAFYKYNGRNFIFILEAFVKYAITKKLYLWKQSPSAQVPRAKLQAKTPTNPEGVAIPRLSGSKLKDLSWSLDIQSNLENQNQNDYES